MRKLVDTVWQRQGFSWIWDEETRNQVCQAEEVWSLRQLLRARGNWPDDLPSNDDRTIVVAGLDGALDLLDPSRVESWLDETVKETLLSFQDHYGGEAALIFWLPSGGTRLKIHPATDAVTWLCGPAHTGQILDFGRILWGEAQEYPQEIHFPAEGQSVGLYHQRIT